MSGPELKIADAPTEAAKEAEPAPGAGRRDWLASIAHLAFIASVAIYGAGFLIAVPHYLRRTVPVRALAHDVFLGAGALFWSLTTVGVACGVATLKMAAPAGSKVLRFGWPGYAFLSVAVLFSQQMASPRASLYVVGVGIATLILYASMKPPDPIEPFHVHVDKYGRLVGMLLAAASSFNLWVFPYVQAPFGGGMEQPLAVATIPNEAPAAAVDSWMKFACRKFTTPAVTAPVCRRFYRVYETTDSLYLGVAEWPGLCNPKEKPRFDESARRCVQRISNALLPQFEVDEGP